MSELKDKARDLVNQFCNKIGVSPENVYDAERETWYLKRGSAAINISLNDVPAGSTTREFLQIYSPIMKVPADKKVELMEEVNELNRVKMGLKVFIYEDYLYGAWERDLVGIDYEEVETIAEDIGWWTDHLDDYLIEKYGSEK